MDDARERRASVGRRLLCPGEAGASGALLRLAIADPRRSAMCAVVVWRHDALFSAFSQAVPAGVRWCGSGERSARPVSRRRRPRRRVGRPPPGRRRRRRRPASPSPAGGAHGGERPAVRLFVARRSLAADQIARGVYAECPRTGSRPRGRGTALLGLDPGREVALGHGGLRHGSSVRSRGRRSSALAMPVVRCIRAV